MIEKWGRHALNVAADEDCLLEGRLPAGCHVVLEGLLFRYKILPDGKRQILGFLIPGEYYGLSGFLLGRSDHSVAAMVASRIATIPFGRLRDLSGSGTAAIQPLWRDILVQDSIAREWIANIGQRRAYQRIAHLLCEMRARLDARPIGGKVTFPWPVSQAAIGDATGMSVVHVNRVLQRLRIERLVVMRDGIVEIQDLERMEDMAGFDPSYLHLRPALDKEDRMTVSRPRVING